MVSKKLKMNVVLILKIEDEYSILSKYVFQDIGHVYLDSHQIKLHSSFLQKYFDLFYLFFIVFIIFFYIYFLIKDIHFHFYYYVYFYFSIIFIFIITCLFFMLYIGHIYLDSYQIKLHISFLQKCFDLFYLYFITFVIFFLHIFIN